MDQKLQNKLYKKYPKIFADRKKPMTETCMCWGINTDNGWYWLLDMLCSQLQWDIDRNGHPQVVASQVKEKYGTLRFYTNREGPNQNGIIDFAEYLSGSICENCGSTEDVSQTKGWIVTLCKKCIKKRRGVARTMINLKILIQNLMKKFKREEKTEIFKPHIQILKSNRPITLKRKYTRKVKENETREIKTT